ncbi:hypothetical protein CPB86DRAFT_736228 [Serendipita vermifera]|nr:hypothetical protein CPB86DRAFT_736228 [Serendipita vermifera]
MNSYPIELLVQHAPLMFVAGLETPSSKQDPFYALINRLREALSARPKGMIWDKNRASAFNILLVDKNIKFPPRKVISGDSQNTPHSPLSPLVPTSPVYPDGLIAPIWVRKHVELVPSIFVLFLRLWESPPPLSPLEGRDREMEQERLHDQELANELQARKRALADRGIKLTAVLLASRRLLDDPGLDNRLTFLRRQSALDARAALFVLSPVSNSELQEFLRSLTEALREPSIEYYTAHSKRVRRKRNKHASSAYSGYPTSGIVTTRAVPLRPIGWTVRYEYKLGTFAELRFEEEVARKHYEDCWSSLSEMFGSVTVLPPRTKRWAEAKVLADSLAIKIYKLYLYNHEHSMALVFFNRHVKRFSDLSKEWGIGEDTFEYWSWMARQYRVLGEMLELALRSGMRLPSLLPQSIDERPLQIGIDAPPAPGMTPATTLEHPGYYFLQAATCTKERLRRFKAIEEAETIRPTAISQSPAFNNEKKVSHWELILDLYTKAYDHSKLHVEGSGRMTFAIGVHIATTYQALGKHEQASRFLERIAKKYRNERWDTALKPVLTSWYESAKESGQTDACISILVERISLSSGVEGERLIEELMGTLKTTQPETDRQALIVELPATQELISSSVIFYQKEAAVGFPTPFQVRLLASSATYIHLLPISSILIHFFEDRPSISINNLEQSTRSDTIPIALGSITLQNSELHQVNGNISLKPDGSIVMYGDISSEVSIETKIARLSFQILVNGWTIEMTIDPSISSNLEPMWLFKPDTSPTLVPFHRPDHSEVFFRPAEPIFDLEIESMGRALIGEEYPIIVIIKNKDQKELAFKFDVLLHPAENETVNYVSFGEERSTGLLRGITFESIKPGESQSRTIYLNCTGSLGKRVLDISLQAWHDSIPSGPEEITAASEILRTIAVETQEPIHYDVFVTYSQSRQGLPAFPNLVDLDDSDFHSCQATVGLVVECTSDCDLEIAEMRLTKTNTHTVSLLHSSLPDGEIKNLVWLPSDRFALDAVVGISVESTADTLPVPSPGHLDISWKRANSKSSKNQSTVTRIILPELHPPDFGLSVIIDPPTAVELHQPFILNVSIRNHDASRSAELSFTIEQADGFVAAGFRTGVLPLLLPGTGDSLSFQLVPISVGLVKLPVFKLQRIVKDESAPTERTESGASLDNRPGEVVPIVDQRWDSVDAKGSNIHFYTREGEALAEIDLSSWLSVLVVS